LTEPWVDKKGLADHLACSVRSIDLAVADGMPYAILMGRKKFQLSEVERWLEAHGRLERRGDEAQPPTPNEGTC
jgi:hypothetical protein